MQGQKMRKYLNDQQLCFDDILLVPQFGMVETRGDVDLSMVLGVDERPFAQIELRTPIISSPMDTVSDTQMLIAMDETGGLGVLHRYMDRHLIISRTEYLRERGTKFGISISTRDASDEVYIQRLLDAGARIFCIDTANGHSFYAINAVSTLRNLLPDTCHIMVGNVSTRAGFYELIKAGADSVRVGIGGGSACTTRIVSGHGMPTLASIVDCFHEFDGTHRAIIADGGIRNTGDMIKAFAAGASAVMLGNLLSGHSESPRKYSEDGEILFRGMASAEAQTDWVGDYRSIEGVSGITPPKGSVLETLKLFHYGIASGCSYSGAEALEDLNQKARYVTVSSLTFDESWPRI